MFRVVVCARDFHIAGTRVGFFTQQTQNLELTSAANARSVAITLLFPPGKKHYDCHQMRHVRVNLKVRRYAYEFGADVLLNRYIASLQL